MPRSRRGDTAETNNFSVWPNDDIRSFTMSTENYGLAVAYLFSSLLCRARISSKNLLVRRTSGFTKPLVRNGIHLSVIKSTFLVSSKKIIKSNVYLMLRPNIVLPCRLSSTYIIINIIEPTYNYCERFLEPNHCSLMYIFCKNYSSKLRRFVYINAGRRPNSHIIAPLYCFLKSQT